MDIIQRDEGDVTILKVDGYIDADTAPILYRTLQNLRDSGRRRFIIDCSGVIYISSQGVVAILKHALALRESGGDIRLASAPECVRMVIGGLRLEKHLMFYPDTKSAAAGFAA